MSIAALDFNYLRELVRERCSIVIDPGKEYLAESRLAGITTVEGYQSVGELLQALRAQAFNGVHRKVLEAMTNNETWFFRDFAPFELLKDEIIPSLLQRRTGTIRIWSAASSSGQEAYSIAMLLREQFPSCARKFNIYGTDFSSAVLERAKAGLYGQLEVNRGLPALMLSKYFQPVGLNWQLKPDIRQAVTFQWLNLAEAWPEMPVADVVFLRNVLIYFDLETRKNILTRLHRVLARDGYLILGGAESTNGLDNSFERVSWRKTSYYRMRGE